VKVRRGRPPQTNGALIRALSDAYTTLVGEAARLNRLMRTPWQLEHWQGHPAEAEPAEGPRPTAEHRQFEHLARKAKHRRLLTKACYRDLSAAVAARAWTAGALAPHRGRPRTAAQLIEDQRAERLLRRLATKLGPDRDSWRALHEVYCNDLDDRALQAGRPARDVSTPEWSTFQELLSRVVPAPLTGITPREHFLGI
jgi:hypothetical protein